MSALLEVRDLSVAYGDAADRCAVAGASLTLDSGAVVGVVGESGSGKSTLARAIIGLLGPSGRIVGGRIHLGGRDLAYLQPSAYRAIRGPEVSMVFQNPMTSLNPVLTVGTQLGEGLRRHTDLRRKALRTRMLELLEMVGLPEPVRRLVSYPHQLSGGMRQRVAIAIAISCRPKLLLADEVTTALDVTVQAQIVALLGRLRRDLGMAVVLVSHNLGVVASLADAIAVMHAGRVVEYGPTQQVLTRPGDPYTRALLGSVPGLNDTIAPPAPPRSECVVSVDGVRVSYPVRSTTSWRRNPHVQAVRGVTFTIRRGETVGLVGESGSGKSSLGRALLHLGTARVEGRIRLDGMDLTSLATRRMRQLRAGAQMIFQDPYSSLDPRLTAAAAIREAVIVHRSAGRRQVADRVRELLALVGLQTKLGERYPHELSGGEVQRVAIARALAVDPRFLVCDEPTSALDVSIQAQIVDLLRSLQRRLGVSYLFISHDLAVVRQLSHRVAVIYLGQVVELASREKLFTRPLHPYTRSLLASVPAVDRAARAQDWPLRGDPADPSNPPSGCGFHTRCPFAQEICTTVQPQATDAGATHSVACHRWADIENGAE